MFCHNCGGKLKKSDKVCGSCGTPADQEEVCGGFWGIVGDVPAAAQLPVEQHMELPSADVPPRMKKNSAILLKGLVAVLAVLLLVQTIRVGVLRNQLENQESLSSQYREDLQAAAEENDLLKEQLNGVTGELQDLCDDVAQLKESLETEEPTEPSEPEETEVPEETEIPEETEVPTDTQPTEEQQSDETVPQNTQVPSEEPTESDN